jgi:hypothetical protein
MERLLTARALVQAARRCRLPGRLHDLRRTPARSRGVKEEAEFCIGMTDISVIPDTDFWLS